MPVFDMSIETVNTVHRIAQFAAIGAALITLISMAVAYWSSSLIKQHSKIVSAEARDQINGLTTALEEERRRANSFWKRPEIVIPLGFILGAGIGLAVGK